MEFDIIEVGSGEGIAGNYCGTYCNCDGNCGDI